MKKQALTILVFLVVTGSTRADFFLYSNNQLTVGSYHSQGDLHDTSSVFITSGGNVTNLNSWGFSTVNISGGSFGNLYAWDSSTVNMSSGGLWYSLLEVSDSSTANISDGSIGSGNAYGHSTINISGGYVDYCIRGYGSSTINMFGGYVNTPAPNDSSIMNMFGGSAYWFSAEGSSTSNIFGGSIDEFYAVGSPTVNISGGSIESLHARDTSTTNIFGQNFQYSSGLILDGNRVFGTGILSGEWLDGTPWAIDIMENYSTATILVPEPATLLFFGLGAVILRKRKQCRKSGGPHTGEKGRKL
jgi:hypothetical protein